MPSCWRVINRGLLPQGQPGAEGAHAMKGQKVSPINVKCQRWWFPLFVLPDNQRVCVWGGSKDVSGIIYQFSEAEPSELLSSQSVYPPKVFDIIEQLKNWICRWLLLVFAIVCILCSSNLDLNDSLAVVGLSRRAPRETIFVVVLCWGSPTVTDTQRTMRFSLLPLSLLHNYRRSSVYLFASQNTMW